MRQHRQGGLNRNTIITLALVILGAGIVAVLATQRKSEGKRQSLDLVWADGFEEKFGADSRRIRISAPRRDIGIHGKGRHGAADCQLHRVVCQC